MGFPIVEVEADGGFVVTKPAGTGGRVTVHTVLEQMLYEIGDPRAYLLPDVSCDFTQVQLTQDGDDRVRLTGARGSAPTASYKVSATYPAGMPCAALFRVGGTDATENRQGAGAGLVHQVDRGVTDQGRRWTNSDNEVVAE